MEWVLSGLFSQTPSWFWDRSGCEEPGKFCLALFGHIVWVWVTRVGIIRDGHRIPGEVNQKALYCGR